LITSATDVILSTSSYLYFHEYGFDLEWLVVSYNVVARGNLAAGAIEGALHRSAYTSSIPKAFFNELTFNVFRPAPGTLDSPELLSAWSLPKEMQTACTWLNIRIALIDT
jgi:hypothetical protein